MANNKLYVRDGIGLSSIGTHDKAAFLEHLNEKAIHEATSNIPYPYSEEDAVRWIDICTARTQKQGKEQLFAIRQSRQTIFSHYSLRFYNPNKNVKKYIAALLNPKFISKPVFYFHL
ncbi:MAG: hypothetical protein SAJ72_24610 [Jaaginema sp. PMC 1080.18]|nr:hypothetical protein [Jaaginema sp. PMC 1080.18]